MKIAVVGLWHLGTVTAACLANAGHDVLAYDPNKETMDQLAIGKAPLFEPGLNELLQATKEKLKLTSHPSNLADCDIIWINFDTPVDDNDIADVESVTTEIKILLPHLKQKAFVLISSQLPVGTTRKLQQFCAQHYPDKKISFGYSPENLRLGKAIEVFSNPDRIIVGLDQESDKGKINQLFHPLIHSPSQIIYMSIESAEMTKHALNAFLATSVVFINELSILCEKVGANAREVEMGLKSEERIGPKAYLRPGNAIAGGTLARDVNFLIQIGQEKQITTPLFSSLLQSNQAHKQWACRRVIDILKNLKDKNIVALGLTYKVGTDTLRRSTAIEMCDWLNQQGAKITAYDPQLTSLSKDLEFIQLKASINDALKNADAVIISTECPEFTALTADDVVNNTKQPFIFDAGGFLAKNLSQDTRIRYFSVGRQA